MIRSITQPALARFPARPSAVACATLCASLLVAPVTALHAQTAPNRATNPAPAKLTSGIDLPSMDRSVPLQQDFYAHANGTWMKKTTIPADKAAVGTLEQIQEKTLGELRGLIEAAAKRRDNPQAQQIGALYASFMDEATLEKLGAKPLAAELAAVDAIGDAKQLVAAMARLGSLGVDVPLTAYVGQDDRDSTRYVPGLWQSGLGLPDRDYYLKEDDAKFKDARAKYAVYLARLLALAGSDADKAGADAAAASVLALETEIARAQWARVETRDPVKAYNRVDLVDLPKLSAAIDWNGMIAASGLAGKTKDVLIGQPSYVTALGTLVAKTPLATWKAYLASHLISAYAPYLSKDFVDARFAFAGRALRGTTENTPRWKRGVGLVDQSIGESLGQVYVARYFPPESKARMDQLVANLLEAYRLSIAKLEWMSPATRDEAQAKLAKFTAKIGYPKRWIDYSSVVIQPDDLVGNVMRARTFAWNRDLNKLGKPIDRDEWGMTPQTINAYYNPSMNEIVFPAAFLQPPTFDVKADDAANYGAIGAVIGHEISHGFDDAGSQYDGDGNLRDWWTKEDRERFSAQTKKLVDQYGAFEPVPGYKVNGELTLGENIADNSGLEIAYKAYRISLGGKRAPVIGGMTGDARFFYGWAQTWRSKVRQEALLKQIKSDPHSPEEYRVNGALRNHPAFYTTFPIKPGDGMYLAPKDRVSIW
ncbi:M13 family metallopeptidase [soil metagenome]